MTAAGQSTGGERKVHVIQGDHHVTDSENVVLTTVLGSCVAACVRDPVAGVGGMNHFLLGEGGGGEDIRYGAYAMEVLINALIAKGADRRRLEAKLFGGARMFHGLSDVGASNARFARKFLQDEGIPLTGESLGGMGARRVEFWPATGRVRQRIVNDNEAVEVTRRAPARPPANDGEVDLF